MIVRTIQPTPLDVSTYASCKINYLVVLALLTPCLIYSCPMYRQKESYFPQLIQHMVIDGSSVGTLNEITAMAWTHVLVAVAGAFTPVLHLLCDDWISSLGLETLRSFDCFSDFTNKISSEKSTFACCPFLSKTGCMAKLLNSSVVTKFGKLFGILFLRKNQKTNSNIPHTTQTECSDKAVAYNQTADSIVNSELQDTSSGENLTSSIMVRENRNPSNKPLVVFGKTNIQKSISEQEEANKKNVNNKTTMWQNHDLAKEIENSKRSCLVKTKNSGSMTAMYNDDDLIELKNDLHYL